MPASSSSLVVSTSVYLLSSALFLGIAYSPVQSSIRTSIVVTVRNVADGISLQLDSLASGGVTVLAWKQSMFQVPVSVSISGYSVTASFRDIVETRQVRWPLPTMLLDPGKTYLASVEGDRVNIETKSLG